MPKRKAIPVRIKRFIRSRQDGKCGCRDRCGENLPPDGKGLVQYQHDPALQTRPVLPDGTDWDPPQHDPDYLFAELKACHARETNEGRSGATTLGSDKHAIAKIKRIRGETGQRTRKPKWASRPMQSGKTKWPKRKFNPRGAPQ